MTRPLLGFSPETFAQRRRRVLEALGGGVLILPAAPPRYRSRDTEHRYRPDSELFYLTGCTEPGALAVLRGGDADDPFLLFLPRRDPKGDLWVGARPGPEEAVERFGADGAHASDLVEDRLEELMRGADRIYFRLGVHRHLDALVVDALQKARSRGARRGEGPRGVLDPGELLDEMRLRKDPEEIRTIRQATALTVAAFRETMERTRPGLGEWEVESLLESAFRRGGARGPAFSTIVGSGGNACTLHYTSNESMLDAGELVLLDGGADVDLYSGDVSRTYPCDGTFTPLQQDVYQVVLTALREALAAVRPGAPVSGVHEAAVLALTRGLVELEVLKGDPMELARGKAYEPFFPHQTSHWLGLDVHDVGEYARGGQTRLLEPGMVLTVEPGLYFSPLVGNPTPFTGLGVRLEDDVLVTEDGAEVLTSALPVAPEEVEELVGIRA